VPDAAELERLQITLREQGVSVTHEAILLRARKLVRAGTASRSKVWQKLGSLDAWFPPEEVQRRTALAKARVQREEREALEKIERDRREGQMQHEAHLRDELERVNEARADAGLAPFTLEQLQERRARAMERKRG
jgi:hypothetical protein